MGLLSQLENTKNIFSQSNLESICCQVDFQNSKPLLICYVYRPPDMHQSWIDDFENEIDYAKESGMELIILGDIQVP
jgi:hypothetical protein